MRIIKIVESLLKFEKKKKNVKSSFKNNNKKIQKNSYECTDTGITRYWNNIKDQTKSLINDCFIFLCNTYVYKTSRL